jgi:hypothetical protein
MIGRKKLSTIREELRQAIRATGEDPIRWLENRLSSPKPGATEKSEVLQSLQRIIEAKQTGKKRQRRTSTRK